MTPRVATPTFWSNVLKTPECWVWGGPIFKPYGPGKCFHDNKTMKAHKVSYILRHGAVPQGLIVTQACGNKLCVKPDHLQLKPITSKAISGLSAKSILEIRTFYEKGLYSIPVLANLYRVNQKTIKNIINNKSWRYVAYEQKKSG